MICSSSNRTIKGVSEAYTASLVPSVRVVVSWVISLFKVSSFCVVCGSLVVLWIVKSFLGACSTRWAYGWFVIFISFAVVSFRKVCPARGVCACEGGVTHRITVAGAEIVESTEGRRSFPYWTLTGVTGSSSVMILWNWGRFSILEVSMKLYSASAPIVLTLHVLQIQVSKIHRVCSYSQCVCRDERTPL